MNPCSRIPLAPTMVSLIVAVALPACSTPAAPFDHQQVFALDGAHAPPLACEACHPAGRFQGTPSTCDGCHHAPYLATTSPSHAASLFSTDCGPCHTTTAWRPARPDFHEVAFPITTGKHAGIPCVHCHAAQAAGNFTQYSCVTCHTLGATAPLHTTVAAFAFDDQSCLTCHPHGNHL